MIGRAQRVNATIRRRSQLVLPWAAGVLLYLFNAWLCAPLFQLNYSARMESAEASFVSISQQMIAHRDDNQWWPLWYNGIPAHQAYPPLLHAVVAETAIATHWTAGRAHHAVTAAFYCLGPVTLFALAFRFSGSLWSSLTSALLYTLLSPTVWVIPWVRNELGSVFRPWRICTLVFNGDSPHITALALIPLVLLTLDRLCRKSGGHGKWVAATLGLSAIALTNWIGSFALAATIFAYLLAITNAPKDWISWAKCFGAAVLAYAFACPWIPPSTWKLIPANSAVLVGDARGIVATLPFRLVLLLALAVGLKLILQKLRVSWPWQFGLLWLIVPGMLPLASEWLKFDFIVQPHRYQLEFDLIVCFLAGLGLSKLARVPLRARAVLASIACVLFLAQARGVNSFITAIIQPIAIEKTLEFRVAQWLQHHGSGGRVLAMGTVSYWLDAFSDVPQLGGGADQGMPHQAVGAAIQFAGTAPSREDPQGAKTLALLQAFGVDYAVVGGPHSANFFKPFQAPERFQSIGEKVWQDGDDFIYRIPRKQNTLAHVVTRADLLQPSATLLPSDADLGRYVNAIETANSPPTQVHWKNRHELWIDAGFQNRDQVLSVQESFSEGWHATVQGSSRAIEKDGLGMMVIAPLCSSPCSVRMVWDGGIEQLCTAIAAFGCAALLLLHWIIASWSAARHKPS